MIWNYLFKSNRLSYSALFCTFLYVHGVLNQIQWNKLRPFHGSDSGEQTKLWSKIIVHNFAKQKDLPSLVFQFKSWVYAKPNSGLCQFGANFLPVLGLTAIVQLTTRDFFFLQNSYLILTLANGLILSWYIYHFGACCCLWLYMRGTDIGGPTAYSIYPHHYKLHLKLFVQYNVVHLDQCNVWILLCPI